MSLRKATIAEVCTPKTAGLQRRAIASGLGSNNERLDSWKQIAVYLNREVRTVQRWEKREDLPVHRHTHLKGSTVYAFKKEIDVWLTGRGQTQSEAHLVQKHSNYTANGVNPPPHVIRQMFGHSRLWFAVVERESYQSFDETVVPDLTLTPHDRYFFIQKPKSERETRSRQLATLRGCRSLSLAEGFLVVHAGASRGRSPCVATKSRSRGER
jgi:hypothetical protein